jgi:group I intron endonuclease
MKCGIYKIENVVDNKYYIGSSNNIDRRWKQHKLSMERSYLHHAIKKYGLTDFHFEVLEECAEKDLLKIEQQYLDIAFLLPHMIYNINPLAACPPNWKGKKRSAESRAKISAANKGKKHSAESCANMSLGMKCKTIHSFRNINTGETYTGILYDFYTKYNLNTGNVSGLIKGKHKSVKGWALV